MKYLWGLASNVVQAILWKAKRVHKISKEVIYVSEYFCHTHIALKSLVTFSKRERERERKRDFIVTYIW
jgi:hypothetical protein